MADSLTMQCGTVCTLCISALIQLSLIDINLRVAKQRNVGRGGGGGAWHEDSTPGIGCIQICAIRNPGKLQHVVQLKCN